MKQIHGQDKWQLYIIDKNMPADAGFKSTSLLLNKNHEYIGVFPNRISKICRKTRLFFCPYISFKSPKDGHLNTNVFRVVNISQYQLFRETLSQTQGIFTSPVT